MVIISNSLNTCVNNYCTVNDIDNMSDHLPLCMDIHLPVNIMHFNDSQYFVPKPKWSSANELMLSEYRHQGLPNLIGRWLPTGQPSIAIWLPNNDWWLPNTAKHKMLTFGG